MNASVRQAGPEDNTPLWVLLDRTFRAYRRNPFRETALHLGVALPVAGLGGFLYAWLLAQISAPLPVLCRQIILYAGAALLLGISPWLRRRANQPGITLTGSPPSERLALGRWETICSLSRRRLGVVVLGILLGLQTGLIQYTPDHAGVGDIAGWRESVVLTADNLCHGIFLDAFEAYDIHLARKLDHSAWSATVFLVFRIACDVAVGLVLFVWFQERRLRRMLGDYPDAATQSSLAAWIEQLLAHRSGWSRSFGEEYVFLKISAALLRGNVAEAEQNRQLFPALRVDDAVRRLLPAPSIFF